MPVEVKKEFTRFNAFLSWKVECAQDVNPWGLSLLRVCKQKSM